MLDGLSNLVEALSNNLMELMPFVVVYEYERGVRYTLGKNARELEPGWHLRVYLLHSVSKIVTVDDAITSAIQSVITKDGKLVCFRASIAYRIVDAVKHLNGVTDFETSTLAIAQRHLAKRVRESTLAELETPEGLKKLEDSLRGTLSTKFRDWGTEVFDVGFIDFAEVPTQVRLFGDHGVLDHLAAH